jgi:hypothetical protein
MGGGAVEARAMSEAEEIEFLSPGERRFLSRYACGTCGARLSAGGAP